jgi:isoleucyl-tRNA synthetase
VVEEAGIVVAVDTELTEALISEGLARDFIRNVQNMRKEAEFDVSDRIHIFIETSDELQQVIGEHQKYISAEILAEELNFNSKSGLFQAEFKLGGKVCSVGIERH